MRRLRSVMRRTAFSALQEKWSPFGSQVSLGPPAQFGGGEMDRTTVAARAPINALANVGWKGTLPTSFADRDTVALGGLTSYGACIEDMFYQAGAHGGSRYTVTARVCRP
jgi:hypothetical protein